MSTRILNAFVSLLIFQSYVHPSQSLSCYKCFYDEENPETYDCLNNPTTVENCTSQDGLETCETISAVSSSNSFRKILLRQCSQNIFGFYCEQGYPMTYEFVLGKTKAEAETYNDINNGIINNNESTTGTTIIQSYQFNLTQVRICFCRSEACNDEVHEPWNIPTTSLQHFQESDPVCHVCVVVNDVAIICPAISCTVYGKNFTKCLTISGTEQEGGSAVTIRKCGSGEENSDECIVSPSEKHYDAGGLEYTLKNGTICACTGKTCNAPPFYYYQNQSFVLEFRTVRFFATLTIILAHFI